MKFDDPVHVFEAEAMNTQFVIRIHHPVRSLAFGLAGNCFCQLEDLEAELSRYRTDSEVTRINGLQAGESMLLADATHRCLQRAMEATAATAGLFDITIGAQTRTSDQVSDNEDASQGRLVLSPDRPQITCEVAGRQIDFGGIGKGFALDEMAVTLTDLEVISAFISSGGSTHLAIGEKPWGVELVGNENRFKLKLKGQALSSSGTAELGAHIVHPDTGIAPEYCFTRVWVICDSAAHADAYSTACLLMDEEEIEGFVTSQEGCVEVYVESLEDHSIRKIG
jgi:thiamine biosynthesis lipoprotein